jgi:hypothetical protein
MGTRAERLAIRSTLAQAVVAGVLAVALVVPSAAAARPDLFAASNESQCLDGHSVNGFLRAHQANVLRVILSPWWAEHVPGVGVACIQAAYNAHYKVYLSLQFSNRWTPRQDADYFARLLPSYAPYLWAIGLGNEQDLAFIVLPGQRNRGLSGAGYRAVWDAVEPVMARLAPRAIRVYGEFTPWAFAANQQGFRHGRPRGVQAIAAHCYHTKIGGLIRVPALAAWAASERLPLWCSEMGPALPRRTTPRWAVPESQASYNRAVARIVALSPDLKMTSYYNSPDL